MPDGIKAKWVNRDAVMKSLAQLSPNIEKQLAIKQLELAGDLAARIRQRAPVGTQRWRRNRQPGQYRRSIIAGLVRDNPKGGELVGIKGTKDKNAAGIYADFIWRWLEFGTVKMQPRPHIFPTYRQRKKYIVRTMRRAMNKGIKDAVAGKTVVGEDANG